MERNLPQGSRQWCGHQKFKVLGYKNPSTAISQFRRAAACPKRGHKAALPHKIWLAFFSSMQTLRLVLLERCTVSWVRLIFRSSPASTQGIKSLLYLSQFWRNICCQPPEARDWPKTPEKKGCNLHIPSYHCCSNVYVFIYKTNIHGQVILDFSREKNDMKSFPKSTSWHMGNYNWDEHAADKLFQMLWLSCPTARGVFLPLCCHLMQTQRNESIHRTQAALKCI